MVPSESPKHVHGGTHTLFLVSLREYQPHVNGVWQGSIELMFKLLQQPLIARLCSLESCQLEEISREQVLQATCSTLADLTVCVHNTTHCFVQPSFKDFRVRNGQNKSHVAHGGSALD